MTIVLVEMVLDCVDLIWGKGVLGLYSKIQIIRLEVRCIIKVLCDHQRPHSAARGIDSMCS
jgi:hypothetical protein